MNVPLVNLKAANARVKKEFLFRAGKIIDSGDFVDGTVAAEFERAFSNFCGAKYCVAVNSGTSALHLAIKTCYQSQDKIVTAPNSFFATAEAISYVTEDVSFEDVDSSANLLIPKERQYDIAVPVSLYGNPCDFDGIQSKCRNLVHDACQAHGAKYRNRGITDFALATCFSFYPTKNLGAFGEGGAVVTNDEALAQEIRRLKIHGQKERNLHSSVGYNYRMDEFQALALLLKTPFLVEDMEFRKGINERYRKNLQGTTIRFLEIDSQAAPAHHLMPIFVDDKVKYTRKLEQAGIQWGSHYPYLITEQAPFMGRWSRRFPKAQSYCNTQISLPLFIGITNEQVDYVCEALINEIN